MQDISVFNVHKNLCSIGLIDNNMIFNMSSGLNCLHLYETPWRIDAYYQQKYYPTEFKFYPAIKANPGWIGCGKSYKNMIFNAKRQGLKRVTIFEDDCEFKNDFDEKYKLICDFLDSRDDWDIFVGCIATLPNNTILSNVVTDNNLQYLFINKMHSAVFNIYSHRSYDRILAWNHNFNDLSTNQIDQYIKRQNMKIVTTYPFEFRCIDIKSTINNVNMYNIYEKMFANSYQIIKMKLAERGII